jgi:hypothetical protein
MTNICRIPFNDEPPSEEEAEEFDEDYAYDEWRQQRDENIAVMKLQNLIAKGKGENDG